jgi:RNA polymerase sigma-19 factor, ECF subfamily
MSSRRDLIGRLYASSHRALRNYVVRLVASGETADEIVQEAFLRTYQNAERLETPRAFLFTTARNLASSLRRTTQSHRTETVGDLSSLDVESNDGPEKCAIAEEELRLLQQAVAQLPTQCGAVFSLRIFQAYSYKDIAERLGISPRTVENHIARALRHTHEYLRVHNANKSGRHG